MAHLFPIAVLAVGVLAPALNAAVIRGVVYEASSGHPLARAAVKIEPVEGTKGTATIVRTSRTGGFVFDQLAAGAYLLSASRYGFAPFKYGQKAWKGAGTPVMVEAGGSAFLDIRLKRFGAIAGTVWDENEVGIPEHGVVAYRATRPPRLAGRAKTDDRGMYRIFGLEPGSYIVRTIARQIDEIGMLPTFAGDTLRVDEARTVEVDLDQQADAVTVRPMSGNLFSVSGRVAMYALMSTTVTLVSDMGKQEVMAGADGRFSFERLAPGQYELEARATNPRTGGDLVGWAALAVEYDITDFRLQMESIPDVSFGFSNTQDERVDPAAVTVLARRKDLSGVGEPRVLKLNGGSARLMLGRWEVAAVPDAGFYVSRFSSRPRPTVYAQNRADGWNGILVRGMPAGAGFVLSAKPGTVSGIVTGTGHDPVPGAPVYLEAWDMERQRRLVDLRAARTDMRGQFRFAGVAPGRYRILSTFEFEEPDPPMMELGGARVIDVSESRETRQELDLFVRN